VTLPETVGRLWRLRERCHGDSCFSIYEIGDDLGTSESSPNGQRNREVATNG